MKHDELNNMIKGWFVGDFEPTMLKTSDVEVGVKRYIAGDYEEFHHHRIATELTCIISGKVKMNGVTYSEGSIITINPTEGTDFEALTDVVNVVVKYPGATNDKYLGAYNETNCS